jgi:hypothetical protein
MAMRFGALFLWWLVATSVLREVIHGRARSSWYIGHTYPYLTLRPHFWSRDEWLPTPTETPTDAQ